MEASLPYTCAVINEIHRRASIAPRALPHWTNAEVEVNGYVIPKNCVVIGNLMRIHHDERYWNDPMAFNPERFYDKENGKCLNDINLNPFGIGKRFCLGQTLAEKELFLFFVGLMKAFKFEASPEHPLPKCDYNSGFSVGVIRCAPLYKVVLKARP